MLKYDIAVTDIGLQLSGICALYELTRQNIQVNGGLVSLNSQTTLNQFGVEASRGGGGEEEKGRH
jgi:hypothetical protein